MKRDTVSIATKELCLYGKKLYDDHDLASLRKIGFIDSDIFSDVMEENIDDIIKYIIEQTDDTHELSKFRYEYGRRDNAVGYKMDWHFDNASIIKHKKDHPIDPKQIKITDTRSLYYYKEKPIYSLVIYNSTHDVDFTGGVLEFIDGYKFYPSKLSYILFSSNELHKVNLMESGERTNYIVKFYL